MLQQIQQVIKKASNPQKSIHLARFFKTGAGEYGEGDIFYGITVPECRNIALSFKDLPLADISSLLKSPVHEHRMIALLILVYRFAKADETIRSEIYKFYMAHTNYINNWDLVDLTADKIVGEYLKKRDRSILIKLAHSTNIWERRISVVATFRFISELKEFNDIFIIADILLHDKHDLIQKAVGWMLREVGKRISMDVEEKFLMVRYRTMPRTTLRYAIERFPEEKRKRYLDGSI